MWLVLCAPADAAALWAYRRLQRHGLTPLELVSPEQLVCSFRWEHRLGVEGVHVAITLADGRAIRDDRVRGVLNRLTAVPPVSFLAAAPADRLYASQEMTALFMCWLSALLPPVLNRPTSQGLSGAWRHPSEWVCLAGRAGLATIPYRQDGRTLPPDMVRLVPASPRTRTVFVVDGQFVGPAVPTGVAEGCRRLAELARTGLLGVELAESADGVWRFAGASPLPDLRLGGEALLEVLAAVLRGRAK